MQLAANMSRGYDAMRVMQYSLVTARLCESTCPQLSAGVTLQLSGSDHQYPGQGWGRGLGGGCQAGAVKTHIFGCPVDQPMKCVICLPVSI